MLKFRQLQIPVTLLKNFTFYSHSSHLIYIYNAQGYISHSNKIIKIHESSIVDIPLLEEVHISLYSESKTIKIWLISSPILNKYKMTKSYHEIADNYYSHLNDLSYEKEKIDKAYDVILKNITDISCTVLAKELYTTSQTLNRYLQKHNTSSLRLIIELKMKLARFMLARTKKPIHCIAKVIGLEASQFSVAFKNEFNVTPLNYRITHSGSRQRLPESSSLDLKI